MMPPGIRSASLASASATVRLSVSSSSTHGPAMTKSASSLKIVTSIAGFDERRRRFATLALHLRRRRDEAGEQRVRTRRTRLELGVELAADEPRMLRILDDLDELPVRAHTAQPKTVLHEQVAILVGHLVPMAMPLT